MPARFGLNHSDHGVLVAILERRRIEVRRLGIEDVFGELKHILRNLDIRAGHRNRETASRTS